MLKIVFLKNKMNYRTVTLYIKVFKIIIHIFLFQKQFLRNKEKNWSGYARQRDAFWGTLNYDAAYDVNGFLNMQNFHN